jgi:hypothetical protein
MRNLQALRQKQQEEANDIRHQLDRELDTIRNLLSGPDLVSGPLKSWLTSCWSLLGRS